MTLPQGTGTRAFPRAAVDTRAARSTLRTPDASLTATVTGEGT
ncbi:hypothetical protein [Streptomyces sp. IB2014 016-6]|nr:hypothetical protein [Streptomyces sp. IB2014 016-6]